MKKHSFIFDLLFIVFFVFLIALAARGFFYILEINLSFVEVFIAFVCCTIVVKWFSMLIKNS
jgi:hypothetical protein